MIGGQTVPSAVRNIFAALVMCAALSLLGPVGPDELWAQDNLPPAPYAYRQLENPAQEAQAQALMETLRCLRCQSQSIADSDATMAGDMRHQVRSRIAAGDSPDQVRAWLISRYGDYVSYEPRVTSATWPLFVIPLLLMLLAGVVLWRRIRPARAPDDGSSEQPGEVQA